MQKALEDSEEAELTISKHVPKEVLSVEFNPSKKLAHFIVELRNTPGALERSAAAATKHGINILSGFHHAPSASNRGFWSFFADFTNVRRTPSELASELKALDSTIDVRFHVPPNGLLIDMFHFPLKWGGQRAIMMRTESISSIFARINGIFGDGPAAKVVLYEMGEAAGQAIYASLMSAIGLDALKQELQQVLALYMTSGWGIFELLHLDFEKKTAAIRVKENFECLHYQKRSPAPRSNFVRGHLAGWFSELFATRVEVTESYCVAKGDEFCSFTIEKPGI